jgi:hypothetical protein
MSTVAGLAIVFVSDSALAQVPKVERVSEIGCDDCGDARQFASTWDVVITAAGDVLVVDRDAPTLRMFDKGGKPLWSRGRRGAGPGEYKFVLRAALSPDGSVHVVDMGQRRLTRLGRDGSVAKSLAFPFFPSAAGAKGQAGEIIVLTDDFRGNGTLERWLPGAETPVRIAKVTMPEPGASISPSVAVAPNGDIAYVGSTDDYVIHRMASNGQPLPHIVRSIPRLRRTPEELAAVRARVGMSQAKVAQEMKQSGGRTVKGLESEDHFTYKPHASADALRYDDSGRLWVRTQRGTARTTVFDVFGAGGGYIGEVVIPMAVASYSLAGSYLATAGERADGIPVVTIWTVR